MPNTPKPATQLAALLSAPLRIKLWLACGLTVVVTAVLVGTDVATSGDALPSGIYDWSIAVAALAVIIPLGELAISYARRSIEVAIEQQHALVVDRLGQVNRTIVQLAGLMAGSERAQVERLDALTTTVAVLGQRLEQVSERVSGRVDADVVGLDSEVIELSRRISHRLGVNGSSLHG